MAVDENLERALRKCFMALRRNREFNERLTTVMINYLQGPTLPARDARMAAKDSHFGPWLIDFCSFYRNDTFYLHALSLVDWNVVKIHLRDDLMPVVDLTEVTLFEEPKLLVFR